MLRKLTGEEIKNIYLFDVYRDFPESEIKPWDVVLRLLDSGKYEGLGYFECGTMMAYALLIIPGDGKSILLDYLAVLPEYRSSGTGSAVLRSLLEHYHGRTEAILIESEHPEEAPDTHIARKRLAFYNRAGAVLTHVQVRLFGVLFMVYVLPCAALSSLDIPAAMENIYRISVPAELYDSKVEIFL